LNIIRFFCERGLFLMIDLTAEKLLTLSQAASLLPGRPSVATLWRWRTKGARGRRLESVLIGGKVFTSAEAIQRFACQQGGAEPQQLRSPTRRERDIRRAEEELADSGI
jgi:hypothetical protein